VDTVGKEGGAKIILANMLLIVIYILMFYEVQRCISHPVCKILK
jgi:hypothetical protein